jgi:hypothetical protein
MLRYFAVHLNQRLNKMKTERVELRISADLKERAVKQAKTEKRSLTKFIEVAVEEKLGKCNNTCNHEFAPIKNGEFITNSTICYKCGYKL